VKKESTYFLKKRSKKHLLLRCFYLTRTCFNLRGPKQTKVFWFFLSKKNIFFRAS